MKCYRIQGRLFVFGGKSSNAKYAEGAWCTTAQCLDLKDQGGVWERLPPMPQALHKPTIAHINRDIYLMGEENNGQLLKYDCKYKVKKYFVLSYIQQNFPNRTVLLLTITQLNFAKHVGQVTFLKLFANVH